MAKRRCRRCGKPYSGDGEKYCSRECYGADQRKTERNEEIIRLVDSGLTRRKVAKMLKLDESRVGYIYAHRYEPQQPTQEPVRKPKPPKRDPTYLRELKKRLPGGKRFKHMKALNGRIYTGPSSYVFHAYDVDSNGCRVASRKWTP